MLLPLALRIKPIRCRRQGQNGRRKSGVLMGILVWGRERGEPRRRIRPSSAPSIRVFFLLRSRVGRLCIDDAFGLKCTPEGMTPVRTWVPCLPHFALLQYTEPTRDSATAAGEYHLANIRQFQVYSHFFYFLQTPIRTSQDTAKKTHSPIRYDKVRNPYDKDGVATSSLPPPSGMFFPLSV